MAAAGTRRDCFQDISAQKAAEEEVRRKSRELEDFFDNSAVALHIVSREGIILRANQAELDLLGYAAKDYVGRHIAEFHVDAPVIGDILQKLTCGEKLDREFILWVWSYPQTRRPKVLKLMREQAAGKQMIRLCSPAEAEKFLEAVEGARNHGASLPGVLRAE